MAWSSKVFGGAGKKGLLVTKEKTDLPHQFVKVKEEVLVTPFPEKTEFGRKLGEAMQGVMEWGGVSMG